MEDEKILREAAMEKFTKLNETEKALVIGMLLGLESAKAQEQQAVFSNMTA